MAADSVANDTHGTGRGAAHASLAETSKARDEEETNEGKEEVTKEGMTAMDEETIKWLRDEAREERDETLLRTCSRALEGDAAAIAAVEETVQVRVGRAHREHRQRGFAP